jgi:hypothetical protein
MPCYDGGYGDDRDRDNHEVEILTKQVEWRDAALCAIFSSIFVPVMTDILDAVDWRTAGIKRKDLEDWWALHQVEDLRKKEVAAEMRKVARERKAAKPRKPKGRHS